MLKLSKEIPARSSYTKSIKFNWCKIDFMIMSDEYREIRSKLRNPMDTCFWCKHKLENGEMMALAQLSEKGRNKILCQDCAAKLEEC